MNTMYRLLIADDALDELECIVFLISKFKLPFEVTSAINGEDALGYLQQEHFDILLTDIQMPFMDGLELSKHALALYPDLRVVIISAHEDFSYAQTAIRLGVCEYLLKPIQPQELNNILQKVLSSLNNPARRVGRGFHCSRQDFSYRTGFGIAISSSITLFLTLQTSFGAL